MIQLMDENLGYMLILIQNTIRLRATLCPDSNSKCPEFDFNDTFKYRIYQISMPKKDKGRCIKFSLQFER